VCRLCTDDFTQEDQEYGWEVVQQILKQIWDKAANEEAQDGKWNVCSVNCCQSSHFWH